MRCHEDDSTKSKSVQQYAADVLGESLVTGVPNIVKATNWPRKLLKFCILILCIGGFFYQTSVFISYFLTYPSILDISVHTPEKYLFPAVTVCNNNGIKRSKFCQRYPERCKTPSNKTQFCHKYPRYCSEPVKWEDFKVPKPEFYNFENNATVKDLIDLGHDKDHLFRIKQVMLPGLEQIEVRGPFIFFKDEKTGFSCCTFHFRVSGPAEAVMIDSFDLGKFVLMKVEVDFEERETFLPGRKPGGFVAVHSPFELTNPFDFGYRINAGESYKINIKMEEEVLLPHPYQSDCMDYMQIWNNNGRKGPKTQEMCKQTCLYDIYMKQCNCSSKTVKYLYNEDSRVCGPLEIRACGVVWDDEFHQCFGRCKQDCQRYKFPYTMRERELDEKDWETEEEKKEHMSYLEFYVSDPKVVVYKQRPHYQDIEVLSYVGGYIGAWLGISFVAIADFMECLLLIFYFASRRFRCKKKVDRE